MRVKNDAEKCITSVILGAAVCWAEEIREQGHIGVVLQEAVGAGKTQTVAGHLTVIATNLCADGILKVRRCNEGEPKGVIVGRYRRYSTDVEFDWMAIPLTIGLIGTNDYNSTPIVASEQINNMVELKYWREQLREELPAMSSQRLEALEKDASKITVGRSVHYALTMGFIADVMDRNQAAEKMQSITDPNDGSIVPAGRWMKTIGIRNQRASAVVLVPSTYEQEQRLMEYLNALPNDKARFTEIGSNCADFSKDALEAAFSDSKESRIRFPTKILNPGDVFGLITSPIMVTKGLLGYAEKNKLKTQVYFATQLASTSPTSAKPRTISRGVLVPDASAGKTAMIMRLIITKLNFWIPVGGLAADLISRPPDLHKEVYESIQSKSEAVRTYGTNKCWKSAEEQFRSVIERAKDKKLLDEDDASSLGKMKSGHVFPVRLEKQGMRAAYDDTNQLYLTLNGETSGLTRENILSYKSNSALSKTLALKIMLAAINYDFAAGPIKRRNAEELDVDWQLLRTISKDNELPVPELASVVQCSMDNLARDPKVKDSLESGMGFGNTVIRSLKSVIRLVL